MKWGFIGNNDLPGVEADARFAAENGFVGLEFNYWGNFADLTEDTVKQMRAALDRHGVGTSALGLWGWNHLSPDPAQREQAHEMLDRAHRTRCHCKRTSVTIQSQARQSLGDLLREPRVQEHRGYELYPHPASSEASPESLATFSSRTHRLSFSTAPPNRRTPH